MNIVGQRLIRVGDLTCPGIDVDEFHEKCRVPLFPDKWNVWRLARSGDANLSQADLEKEALQTMRRWFQSFDLTGTRQKQTGDFFHEKFQPVTSAKAFGSNMLVSRFKCPIPITLAGESNLFIDIAFVFRGSSKSKGWPTLRQLTPDINPFFNEGVLCPSNATWVVDSVYEPLKEPVPKSDPGVFDEVGEKIEGVGKGLVIVAAAVGLVALLVALK